MTDEPTALWTWPSIYDKPVSVTFDAAALAYVRSQQVWWDATENGAAGIEAPETEPVPKQANHLVDLFLHLAQLPSKSGTISNPYEDGGDLWRITDAPDSDVVAQFTEGAATIPYTVTDEDRALWAEASKREEGIDCKRPFGSENVARDLRPLLDPDKTLSNAAFKKRRDAAESRMLLFLQFFVQQAELPSGTYIRGKDYVWRPEAEAQDGGPERLDWNDWALRVISEVQRKSQDYTKTALAVAQLAEEKRIRGDYAKLCEELRLHDLYGTRYSVKYEGHPRDMAEVGLAAFDEAARPFEQRVLSMNLTRICNGTADFTGAKAAMQAAGLWGLGPEECSVWPLNPQANCYLEEAIASYGLGEISFSDFMRRAHGNIKGSSSHVYDILHRVGRWKDGAPNGIPSNRYSAARAIAAQVFVMRWG